MKLGVDLSIQKELDELGPKYYYEGKEVEPFNFFAKHSKISIARFRLWVNPYDDNGNPYGGGTNDLKTFIELAKRAQKEGMEVMLDFHYSDFYVDPSRQRLPRSWKNIKSFPLLLDKVYAYTRETLEEIKANNIDLVAVQIGNEITHGMLWPFGNIEYTYNPEKGGGFEGLSKILKAGIKATKEIYPHAKTLIHLEHSGSYDMQDWYLSNIIKQGVEFDGIGESYYTYWHGPFSMFKDCISKIKEKFHKEIWIVELGYEYKQKEGPIDYSEVTDAKEGDFIVGNVNGRIPFPKTKEGQKDFIALMLKICKELGVEAVFYWEPSWIYMPNNGWAKDAGQIYCGLTPSAPFNVWTIETLFDLEGNANPAVEVFTQDYVDSL